MKVTFEFDDTIEDFDICQFNRFKAVDDVTFCLSQISDQLKEWYSYDNRGEIPISEVYDTIMDIITERVDLEKLGY